jgi:uncharacterized NAD(P)/FAD-binding protein YdhS
MTGTARCTRDGGHRPTVAVIGGGFSGAVAALHLLRDLPPSGLDVVLVNRSGPLARGIAYGTNSDRHVLNVPAGAMSALPDDPGHFVRYCCQHGRDTAPGDFVPRALYGAYLGDQLAEAERSASSGGTLVRLIDTVLGLSVCDGGQAAWLRMAQGPAIRADHVILALGHFVPADPRAVGASVRDSGRYVRDPWASKALECIEPHDDVALLGSGLTALDIALALHQRGHRGEIWSLSRRGLMPHAHRVSASAVAWKAGGELLAALMSGPRPGMRALRAEVALAAHQGGDWRDVIAGLRPHTPSIWHAWPELERRRFMRHLQGYWDVHRHRCAPQADVLGNQLRASGRWTTQAGRLMEVQSHEGSLLLRWQPRGGEQSVTQRTKWLVNCTGPDSRLASSESPIVMDLVRQGLIRPDALGLGLDITDDGALIDAAGQPSSLLRYVGPLAKARDWEATAVPELRSQAKDVARRVLQALAAKRASESALRG